MSEITLMLNGVPVKYQGNFTIPASPEQMSLKELAQRLKHLKELLATTGSFKAGYDEATLLDAELDKAGLSLSFFEGDGNYCVYLKEEV
jgi:hypothetical protein